METVELPPVLSETNGFEMIAVFAAPDAGEDLPFLFLAIRWNQSHDRCADHFVVSVSEDALRPEIPTGDDTVQILSNNRIVGRGDDGCKLASSDFGQMAVSGVAKGPDPSIIFSVLTPNRRRVSVQKSPVDEFNLILADFVRMGIKIDDFLDKLSGILDLLGHPREFRSIVKFVGNLSGNIPYIDHPLVLEYFPSFAVNDQDSIKSRINLGLKEGGFPDKLLLRPLALGHVIHDRDEMGNDSFFGAHGGDRVLVLVEAPVFATVGEVAAPCFAGEDGGPKILVKLLVVLPGLEQSRIFAHNLFGSVAGQAGEGGVDPKYDALAVSDDDRVRSGFQRGCDDDRVRSSFQRGGIF